MQDDTRSLREIFGREMPPPALESYVLRTAYRAWQKPLRDLSAEKICLLIGQKCGIRAILPMALDILARGILAEICFYPGDLLAECLRLNLTDWAENPAELERFRRMVHHHEAEISACTEIPNRLVAEFLHPTELPTPCGILR